MCLLIRKGIVNFWWPWEGKGLLVSWDASLVHLHCITCTFPIGSLDINFVFGCFDRNLCVCQNIVQVFNTDFTILFLLKNFGYMLHNFACSCSSTIF